MKESDIRTHVTNALEKYDYKHITQQDTSICKFCGKSWYPEGGRPDVTYTHPYSFSIFVEYKMLKLTVAKSLAFTLVSDVQTDWLNDWAGRHNGLGYVGVGVVDKVGIRERALDIFLVDWQGWLDTKELVTPHQLSIPYAFSKGMRKALIQDGIHYDMITLWKQYRLDKAEQGYTLPAGHSAIPHRRRDEHGNYYV
jgi:hypothetical protein